MTKLILIRHGETAWNRQRRYQGLSDRSLIVESRRKMRQLAQGLRPGAADILFTSALKRAKESGAILSRSLGLNPVEDERLNELDLGDWEGKTAGELIQKADKRYLKWLSGEWVTPPNGESVRSLRKRIRHFLNDILRDHQNKKIIAVSHAGPLRMILLEVLNVPSKHMFQYRVDPGSVTTINFYPGAVELESLNNNSFKF